MTTRQLVRVVCSVFLVVASAAGLCAPRVLADACIGDCNGDGQVTVDELITGVDIALGMAPLASCATMDVNVDKRVTVDELLQAVEDALSGCPAATPTVHPTAAVACPRHPPLVFSVQSPTTGTVQVIEGCTDAPASGPIRIFSGTDAAEATLTDDPCPPGYTRFRAAIHMWSVVSPITVCHTRSPACGPLTEPLCTRFDEAGQPLNIIYTTPTPSPTETCSGPCPPTPTATPTPTQPCGPTATPYCADVCYPCPTIRENCYAGACGECIQNPSCRPDEVCVIGPYGSIGGCCSSCVTPTASRTPTPTPTGPTPTYTQSPTLTQSPTVTPTRTPASGRFLYVRQGYALEVFDAASRMIVTYEPVNGYSGAMAAAPDGRKLYVGAGYSSLAVVDTTTNVVSGYIQIHPGSWENIAGIAVSPNGDRLYVGEYGYSGTTTVIDAATEEVTASIALPPLAWQGAIVLGHKLPRAYVALDAAGVGVIDTDENALLDTIPVFGFPAALAVNPSDARVYVVSNGWWVPTSYATSATIYLIDTQTAAVSAIVPFSSRLYDLALTPDGALAYVTDAGAPRVFVLETATWTPIAEIPVDSEAANVAVDPDGRYVYVGNGSACTVSVIDNATYSVVDKLGLRDTFDWIRGLAIVDVPDGHASNSTRGVTTRSW